MSYKNHSCDVCKRKPDCTIWGAVQQAGIRVCYSFIPYAEDGIESCGNCMSESMCDEAFSQGKTTYCSAFYVPKKEIKMNTDKYNVNLETKTFDSVKNPPYYTEGRQYEPRKVIEDWGLNFYLGNVVKYISRAGRKDVKTQYEDLLKAYQYLEWELDRLRLLDEEDPSK